MGFFQQLLGQEGGPLIPGVDNPFQGGTILPGGGALNPFNPGSAAGQAFAGVGQFNIWNPDSAVGKAANDLARDLGTGLQAIANDPRKLAAVGIMVAFPGAASAIGSYLLPTSVAAAYPTLTAIVGQTALNTATNGGDVKQAVTNALISQGAPQLTKYIADSYATEGISKAVTDWAAKATVDSTIAAAMGKDPTAALLFSGAKAAADVVLKDSVMQTSLSMMPKEAASAVKAAITAKIMNIDPSKAVAQDLINQAIGSAQGMVKAQWYAKTNNLAPLTQEQLNAIPPEAASDPNHIQNIVKDANAQNEGWRDSYEKFIASEQGITNPNEWKEKTAPPSPSERVVASGNFGGFTGKIYEDGSFQPAGEDKSRTPTYEEAQALKDVYRRWGSEVPEKVQNVLERGEPTVGPLPTETPKAPEPVEEPTVGALPTETPKAPDEVKEPAGGLDTGTTEPPPATVEPPGGLSADRGQKLQEAQELGKSGDFLGQINMMRDIVGLPRYDSIDQYEADQARMRRADEEEPAGGLPPAPTETTEPTEPITGGLPVETETPSTETPGGLPVGGEEPGSEIPTEIPPIDQWEPQQPVTETPNPEEPDWMIGEPPPPEPEPVPEPAPEEGPEDCAPGYHWNGSMCVPDDDEPPESTDCPEGYVYDMATKSCVPIPDTTTPSPTTKPPTTTPPATKTPTTTTTTTQPATQTGGLPATTQQNPFNIPWLDTKPQMLEVKARPTTNTSSEALKQLYDRVDPSLMDVFAERGFAPQGYSGGSSVTDVFSDFASNLEKGTPKFAQVRDPMISTGVRKAKQSGLGAAPQLPQLRTSLTGNARGGLPAKYAQAAPKGHNPEFITGLTGFYANGRGTGQSDDIPAMLHDGDYVMDADTVAALGDGSSKAGALSLADFQKQVPHEYKAGGNAVPAKIADGEYVFPEPLVTSLGGGDNKKGAQLLDAMREEIRAHKRSAPTSKIPPKAKSPLDYLKMVKG